jgi:hypothetical protein
MLLVTSCVTSLQPLVTANTAIKDDRLLGTWKEDDLEYTVQMVYKSDFYLKHKPDIEKTSQNKKEPLSGKEKNDSILYSKSYIIKYLKKGVKYEIFGGLIKLNGQLFMNFAPVDMNRVDSQDVETEINLENRISSFTIARLQFTSPNKIQLDFIDGGFLYDQIKTGRMKIKHESDDLYDSFLITASTTELQQFLVKYGNDNRFFTKENSVILTRKS